MMRRLLFRNGEVIRLPDDTFGTVLAGKMMSEDDIYADSGKATVLLFEQFRKPGDCGLRDVPVKELRKQYDENPIDQFLNGLELRIPK